MIGRRALAVFFLPRHTSRSRLQAYALEAATLLKADRNTAIRRRRRRLHAGRCAIARAIRSGATSADRSAFPDDVRFRCAAAADLPAARGAVDHQFFSPTAMSCGGSIALSRLDTAYEIRVNWLDRKDRNCLSFGRLPN